MTSTLPPPCCWGRSTLVSAEGGGGRGGRGGRGVRRKRLPLLSVKRFSFVESYQGSSLSPQTPSAISLLSARSQCALPDQLLSALTFSFLSGFAQFSLCHSSSIFFSLTETVVKPRQHALVPKQTPRSLKTTFCFFRVSGWLIGKNQMEKALFLPACADNERTSSLLT